VTEVTGYELQSRLEAGWGMRERGRMTGKVVAGYTPA
jgi:hypothetical protein